MCVCVCLCSNFMHRCSVYEVVSCRSIEGIIAKRAKSNYSLPWLHMASRIVITTNTTTKTTTITNITTKASKQANKCSVQLKHNSAGSNQADLLTRLPSSGEATKQSYNSNNTNNCNNYKPQNNQATTFCQRQSAKICASSAQQAHILTPIHMHQCNTHVSTRYPFIR